MRALRPPPRNLFAATFIGDANVLPCSVIRLDGNLAIVELDGLVVSGRRQTDLSGGVFAATVTRGGWKSVLMAASSVDVA